MPTVTLIDKLLDEGSSGDGHVVPSRQDGIKVNGYFLAKRFGGLSFGLIHLLDRIPFVTSGGKQDLFPRLFNSVSAGLKLVI